MSENILIIYTKKDTGKYYRYEMYPLNKNISREMVETSVANYNKDESKDLHAEIYDNQIWIDFVEDVTYSRSVSNLISNLRSICSDIESSVEDLESWTDDIESFIKNNGADEDV